MSEGKGIAILATLLLASLFTSVLLAYDNSILRDDNGILRGEVAALNEKLSLKASEIEALENRLERLLEEKDALNSSYSSLLTAHQKLLRENEELSGSYTSLMARYVELTAAYASLNRSYAGLNSSYSHLLRESEELGRSYSALMGRYADLNRSYSELLAEYRELLEDYLSLKAMREGDACSALFSPLRSDEILTPTVNELKQWLAEDETDSIAYSEWDFVCGDYAAILSMRAKLKRWDMGIVAVIGRGANGEVFGHVFNAIRCAEGLFYVEPQNDGVFSGPIAEGGWYSHPGLGMVYVETFLIVLPYQPPF